MASSSPIDRQRGREKVQEIARPDVFEESHRHALHHPDEEIPKKDGAQQRRHEVDTRGSDCVQVFGDEPPKHDVDGDPGEQREDPGWAPSQQVEVTKHDGGDALGSHIRYPWSESGSRATAIKRSIGLVVLVGAGFYLLDPRRGSDAPAGGYEDDMVNVFTQQERFAAVVHRTVYEFLPQLWKSTTVSAFGHQLGPGIDLLVCDFYLNSVYNIDLCRNISSINPSPSVLIISNQDELIYAERMIKTGACGYIMKNETPEKIIEALLTVLSGEIYVSKKFSSTVASKIRYSYSSQQDLIINTLSERELEVFMMIGKGIYSKEIADKLFISLKTVEAIRKRLRIKLKLSDSRSLVKLAVSWTNRQENE